MTSRPWRRASNRDTVESRPPECRTIARVMSGEIVTAGFAQGRAAHGHAGHFRQGEPELAADPAGDVLERRRAQARHVVEETMVELRAHRGQGAADLLEVGDAAADRVRHAGEGDLD